MLTLHIASFSPRMVMNSRNWFEKQDKVLVQSNCQKLSQSQREWGSDNAEISSKDSDSCSHEEQVDVTLQSRTQQKMRNSVTIKYTVYSFLISTKNRKELSLWVQQVRVYIRQLALEILKGKVYLHCEASKLRVKRLRRKAMHSI